MAFDMFFRVIMVLKLHFQGQQIVNAYLFPIIITPWEQTFANNNKAFQNKTQRTF